MRQNRLRQLLDAGQPTVGTHIMSTWPALVELAGQTGQYDYVELVGEYAPYDLYALENISRAADLYNMSTMLKVDQNPRTFLAQRGLGSGFQAILFADVRTVEEAQECVRIVRPETPEIGGIHGAGMRRNAGYVQEIGSPAFVESLQQAVVALMIEKKGAVEDLEAICSIKGLDMVQFGPADYSMSVGMPGRWREPEIQAVDKRIIETALRYGVAPRIEIGNFEDAKRYIDMGVKHFCIGTDVVILSRWWHEHGEGMRKLLEQVK